MQIRERRLLLIAAGTVILWLVDSLALRPLLHWQAGIEQQMQADRLAIMEDEALLLRRTAIMAQWRSWHAAGLMDDAASAAYRLHQMASTAAHDSGVVITSLGGSRHRPATAEALYDSLEISLRSEGSSAQVQAFLETINRSAMPLRIERCDLHARDTALDRLDCSLTISTRIVSAQHAQGLTLPPDISPWTPTASPPALDQTRHRRLALLFRADRPAPTPPAAPPTPRPGPVAPVVTAPVRTWVVTGLILPVADPAGGRAFVRHQGLGTERIVTVGDQLDDRLVLAVDRDGLLLATGDDTPPLRIAPGQDILGRTAVSSSPEPSAPRPATTTPSAAAPALNDPARQAILDRLRQQRTRSTAP